MPNLSTETRSQVGDGPWSGFARERSPPMGVVLAMIAGARLRQRVRIGMRSRPVHRLVDEVRFVPNVRELDAASMHLPASPAFVDPYGGRADHMDALLGLHRRRPHLGLISYSATDESHAAASDGVRTAFSATLRAGVDDGFARIGAAARGAIGLAEVRALAERIRETAPRSAHDLLDRLLDATVGRCSVSELAALVGVSDPTLRRRCAAWGLPRPRRLLALARLYHVARLAQWSGKPASVAALALGWSDEANYARLVRNELGCRQSAVAGLGGPEYVARELLAAIGGRRPAASHP